jgi:hypothetical protein
MQFCWSYCHGRRGEPRGGRDKRKMNEEKTGKNKTNRERGRDVVAVAAAAVVTAVADEEKNKEVERNNK